MGALESLSIIIEQSQIATLFGGPVVFTT